jgi:hypothetical protein
VTQLPDPHPDSRELTTGNLPAGKIDGDGNPEISNNRDSRIPTAAATAAGQ